MGTCVAQMYVNIFMSYFKEKWVYPHKLSPLIWYCFIDDIWAVIRSSTEDLCQFHTEIKQVHPSIKFTMEFSTQRVTF